MIENYAFYNKGKVRPVKIFFKNETYKKSLKPTLSSAKK